MGAKRVLAVAAAVGVVVLLWLWRSGHDSSDGVKAESSRGTSSASAPGAPAKGTAYAVGEKAPTCAVSGTVSRGDKPLSGAIIRFMPERGDLVSARTPGRAAPPIVATSRSDGRFELSSVVDGPYTVAATHPSAVGATTRVAQVCSTDAIDIVLGDETGVVLSGTVVDVLGGPVAGALVSAGGANSMLEGRDASVATTTDNDGAYRLRLTQGSYAVGATHADYVTHTDNIDILGDTTLDLVLTPSGAIEGTVVHAATGEPVEGARVTAGGDEGFAGLGSGSGVNVVTTDERGRFRLRNIKPGVVRLSARHKGLASTTPTTLSLSIAEQIDSVVVYVDEAYSISGRVIDEREPDSGIEGVYVAILDLGAQQGTYSEIPTGADGRFVIDGVRPGTYMLNGIGGSALTKFMGGSVTIVDRDLENVTLELDRGARIRGRVSPNVPASIRLEADFGKAGMNKMMAIGASLMARTRTGSDGRFEIGPVTQASFSVVAEADDGRIGKTDVEVGEENPDVVIELEDGIRVAGRVVDENGAPLASVRVRVQPRKSTAMRGFAMGHTPGKPTAGGGEFDIRVAEPGEYAISVHDRRGQLAWTNTSGDNFSKKIGPGGSGGATEKLIEVPEGGLDDLTLEVVAPRAEIKGTVVDGSGAPVADAWVRAQPDNEGMFVSPPPPTLTGEDGRFVIDGLRPGTLTLSASSSTGMTTAKEEKVATGSTVRLQLQPFGSITGIVTSGGAPLHPYVVRLAGIRFFGTSQRIYAEDGRFTFERIEPGEYEVKVKADVGQASGTIKVSAGMTAELNLAIESFAKVSGRLVDEGGAPVAGASIWPMVTGGDKPDVDVDDVMKMISGEGPKTDQNGRFEIDRVPIGEVSVMFFESAQSEVGAGSLKIGAQPMASRKLTTEPGAAIDLGDVIVGEGIGEGDGEGDGDDPDAPAPAEPAGEGSESPED